MYFLTSTRMCHVPAREGCPHSIGDCGRGKGSQAAAAAAAVTQLAGGGGGGGGVDGSRQLSVREVKEKREGGRGRGVGSARRAAPARASASDQVAAA